MGGGIHKKGIGTRERSLAGFLRRWMQLLFGCGGVYTPNSSQKLLVTMAMTIMRIIVQMK